MVVFQSSSVTATNDPSPQLSVRRHRCATSLSPLRLVQRRPISQTRPSGEQDPPALGSSGGLLEVGHSPRQVCAGTGEWLRRCTRNPGEGGGQSCRPGS